MSLTCDEFLAAAKQCMAVEAEAQRGQVPREVAQALKSISQIVMRRKVSRGDGKGAGKWAMRRKVIRGDVKGAGEWAMRGEVSRGDGKGAGKWAMRRKVAQALSQFVIRRRASRV